MNKFSVVCLTVGVGIGSLGAGMALQAALFDVPDRGSSHVEPEIKREPANPRALPGVAAPNNRTNPDKEKMVVEVCNNFTAVINKTHSDFKRGLSRDDVKKEVNDQIDRATPEDLFGFKKIYSGIVDIIYGNEYVYTPEQLRNYSYQVCDLQIHKVFAGQ